ncbi:MAG: glycosyltransferase family 2 protein, partial [Ilumatobacter sp.]
MSDAAGLTIGVGVVSYNTRAALGSCLESLVRQAGVHVAMVADNGSSDGSLAMVERDFPNVLTISLPANPGYGAAANELVRVTATDVMVLLNADVRLPDGAIAALGEHLERRPDVGVVGPRLVGDDGRLQRSCFAEPTVTELMWAESGLHRFRPSLRPEPIHAFGHDRVRSVPWVLGAVMAIRRTAFEEVGGFDDGFFLYYEEVDLCRRFRAAGWDVQFTPDVEVVHTGGASIGQRRELGQRTMYRSLHRYHTKHTSASTAALRSAVAGIMTARLVRDLAGSRWARSERARRDAASSAVVWRGVLADVQRGWRPP